jgi:hypothetical protein
MWSISSCSEPRISPSAREDLAIGLNLGRYKDDGLEVVLHVPGDGPRAQALVIAAEVFLQELRGRCSEVRVHKCYRTRRGQHIAPRQHG